MTIPDLPVDEWGTVTVKTSADETVQVMPMIYNNRITIGPTEELSVGYAHGWCYDKGPAAVLAALAWDPLTEDEPAGYKKRATPGIRKAPNRD